MSKFQIYHTEDLITIESKRQTIAVIGYSISKTKNTSQARMSQRVFNFLESLNHSYSIQATKTYIRFFIFVSAQDAGEVINKVSILLDRIDRVGPIDSHLVFSPLNHNNIVKYLQTLEYSNIKRTSNPWICQIDNRFWLFSSLIFSQNNSRYFTKYTKSILSHKASVLNLSTQIVKRGGKLKRMRTIVFYNNFSSFVECEEYIRHLKRISLQYKQKLSFSMNFHTHREIKRRGFLFFFGLSNENQETSLWNDILRIDMLIPYLEVFSDTAVQEVELKDTEELIATNKEKLPVKKEIQKKSVHLQNDPIFPYGKEVSKNEIDRLVKNIPAPKS